MLTVRQDQLKQIAAAQPGQKTIVPCGDSAAWVEVRLVDGEQQPVGGEVYRIELPDMSIREGALDETGCVRIEGIISGQCRITFPNVDGGEWKAL